MASMPEVGRNQEDLAKVKQELEKLKDLNRAAHAEQLKQAAELAATKVKAERDYYKVRAQLEQEHNMLLQNTEAENELSWLNFEKKKLEQQKEALTKYKADLEARKQAEYEALVAANADASKAERDRWKKQLDDKYKYNSRLFDEQQKKEAKKRKAQQEKEEREQKRKNATAAVTDAFSAGKTMEERLDSLLSLKAEKYENGNLVTDIGGTIGNIVNAMSDLARQMEGNVDKIAGKKGAIDTRLHGSKQDTVLGSYYDSIQKQFTIASGFNGFFKQETLYSNLESLVAQGISHNVDQRAFLMTIKDKIATTFNVADSTLLKLVRIQQEDTTAGRLGMESALNAFLNNMYETTEYMQSIASSVRASLSEMESLMSGAQAAEIEYQVQKWMGSMYSVGMSDEAVNSIASTFGKIAAGDVSGITSGGTGNLLVMAANEAGLSISDILAGGVSSEETNDLMQAMVNYLAEIADSSSDSRVVQQQLANVYGLKASDLKAITNLASSTKDVYGKAMSYDNMLNELNSMTNSMGMRTSMGEFMNNIWDNSQWSLASNMASSPFSYLTYKMAGLLKSTTGGINIPAISVMGNMVDLQTTVADLMTVGSMASPILQTLGSAMTGLAGNIVPSSMLRMMGIGKGSGNMVSRGTGVVTKAASGSDVSISGAVGNSNASDIQSATLAGAEDEKNEQMIKAQENYTDVTNMDIVNSVDSIYKLLDGVVNGDKSLLVRIDGWNGTGITGDPFSYPGNTGASVVSYH